MDLKDLNIIKQDERGTIYDCDKVKYITRKKGTISANHVHNVQETFYLISGEIELTIGNETKIVKAPIKIVIKPKEYHKLFALSDFELIEDRIGE